MPDIVVDNGNAQWGRGRERGRGRELELALALVGIGICLSCRIKVRAYRGHVAKSTVGKQKPQKPTNTLRTKAQHTDG